MGASEEEIIADWESLLVERKGTVVSIIAVLGVQVKSAIGVASGVSVAPPQDIPNSREREELFRINRWNEPVISFGLFEGTNRVPGAALLVETPDVLIIKDGLIIESGKPKTEIQRLNERISAATDNALAALTLSGRCAPVTSWTYDVAIHPAIPPSGLGGTGASGAFTPPPFASAPVDPDTVRAVYAEIGRMKKKDWTSLKLSIERLARSRGHAAPSLADRAIDLGIAIESSLLHGEKGPGAKGELRNKVGTRGAWLIADTPDERKKVFEVLRNAYDARSSAVHSGVLKPKEAAGLDEADDMCAGLLRRIVQAGHFPSWDKLTLGFGPAAWETASSPVN